MGKVLVVAVIILGLGIFAFQPVALCFELIHHDSPMPTWALLIFRGLMAVAGLGLIVVGLRRVKSVWAD